jgi:hypothetical protein
MSNKSLKRSFSSAKGELKRCSVCEDYLSSNEGFYCPKCKKGPLCKRHSFPEKKECVSCVTETKLYETNVLRSQEKGIKSFIRFLQFIFFVFSIFFISSKFGILEEVEMLKHTIASEDLLYIGIATVILYGIFYFVLFNQRQNIIRLESEIGEIRRRYH